jgi:putative membrane protein
MNRLLATAAASLTFAALLCACSERTDPDDARMASDTPMSAAEPAVAGTDATGDATTADDAAASPGAGTSESAALGVLNAINAHEIAAGEQALRKGVKGEVAAFAQMMIDQHTDNREKTLALNPDASASDATAQQRKGEAELAALEAKSGDDYARAYIDAMIKGHTEALDTLDTRLIPAATSEPVRQHLTATRGHVATHLEQAQRLATNAPAN